MSIAVLSRLPPKSHPALFNLFQGSPFEVSCDVKDLEKVTAAAFGQRRKMLRSSLRGAFDEPETILAELGINPELRAEQLQVNDFARLAKVLGER